MFSMRDICVSWKRDTAGSFAKRYDEIAKFNSHFRRVSENSDTYRLHRNADESTCYTPACKICVRLRNVKISAATVQGDSRL